MKAIGARLALWYAGVSTATLVSMFVAGFFLLGNYLDRGLDRTNFAEFERIKASLGTRWLDLSEEMQAERLRDAPEISGTPSFVEVRNIRNQIIAASANLGSETLGVENTSGIVTVHSPTLGKVRARAFPLGPFHLVVGVSYSEVGEVMDGYTETCLILVSGMLVVSVITGLLMSRAAMRPIRLIQETANRIRSDNLSERIKVPEVQDEIANLASLLNEMFDRLEVSFNQIRKFTAEASHELKTPLSLIRLHAERILIDGGLSVPHEEALQMQLEEITRLHRIIEDLLFLSRAEAQAIQLKLRRDEAAAFIRNFAADAAMLAEHAGVALAVKIEGRGRADFDAKWMRQVLFNLVQNALNVAPKGSTITLSSEVTGPIWRVAVEDQGPGVAPDLRERIFERFVRLSSGIEPSVRGSGLGLTISRSIIGLHRGTIRAEAATKGPGLRVVFELPLAALSDDPDASAPAELGAG